MATVGTWGLLGGVDADDLSHGHHVGQYPAQAHLAAPGITPDAAQLGALRAAPAADHPRDAEHHDNEVRKDPVTSGNADAGVFAFMQAEAAGSSHLPLIT
ncbi:hypothetical protein ACQPXS_37620 [Streptomyces sp. CA-142005]|uniref:hypothetical protein n=1 Tax=Streptomyces sp. CA-142005 TaxID=3240052 RepID=UPI003D8B3103